MKGKHKHQKNRRCILKSIVTGALTAISFNSLAISDRNIKKANVKMDIKFIISFETKMEKVTDFIKILENVKIDLPKVKGCIGVNIFKSSLDRNKFTLVETWETEKLHKAHIDNLSKNGTWDIIASHLLKDPESGYFIQL